jgi:hypothetical protein
MTTRAEPPRLFPFAMVAAVVISACSNQISMSDCQRDADCERAYNMVVSANQTVSNACPRNPKETTPACDSAMATLNSAEAGIFPRLKSDDALLLSESLMASR